MLTLSSLIHSRGSFFTPLAISLSGARPVSHRVVLGVAADQRDHLVGLAGNGGADRGLAGEEGLVDVGLGGGMRGGALDEARAGDAHLHGRECWPR
jgi:hypothetical protein